MSLLDALSSKENQSGQGWTYSNRYSQDPCSVDNNIPTSSAEKRPGHSSQQHRELKTTAGSCSSTCAEIISSESEDEVKLMGDSDDDDLILADAHPMDDRKDSFSGHVPNDNHSQNVHPRSGCRPGAMQTAGRSPRQTGYRYPQLGASPQMNSHRPRHEQMRLRCVVRGNDVPYRFPGPSSQLQNPGPRCPRPHNSQGVGGANQRNMTHNIQHSRQQLRQTERFVTRANTYPQRKHFPTSNMTSQSTMQSTYGSHNENGNSHGLLDQESFPVEPNQPPDTMDQYGSPYHNTRLTSQPRGQGPWRSWHVPQQKQQSYSQNPRQRQQQRAQQAFPSQLRHCSPGPAWGANNGSGPPRAQMCQSNEQFGLSPQEHLSSQEISQLSPQSSQSSRQSHDTVHENPDGSWETSAQGSWESSPTVSPYFPQPSKSSPPDRTHSAFVQNSIRNCSVVLERQKLPQDMLNRSRRPAPGRLRSSIDRSQSGRHVSLQEDRLDEEERSQQDGELFSSREGMSAAAERRLHVDHGNEDYGSNDGDPGISMCEESEHSESVETCSDFNEEDDGTVYSVVNVLADRELAVVDDDHTVNGWTTEPMAAQTADSFTGEQMVDQVDAEFEDSFYDEEEDSDEYGEAMLSEYGGPMDEDDPDGMDNHSPPPLPVTVPRMSAMKDVWPTPMPRLTQDVEMKDPGAEDTAVEFVSSSSQRSCDFSSAADTSVPPPEPAGTSKTAPPGEASEDGCPKRAFAEDEEGVPLCQYCGHTSSNLEVCENCHQAFPPETRTLKKRKMDAAKTTSDRERTCGGGKVNGSPPSSGLTMDKKVFYGNRRTAQNDGVSRNLDDTSENFVIRNNGRSFTRLNRIVTSYSAAPPRKLRQIREPVTVTISSDEDEGPSGEGSQQQASSSKPVPTTPPAPLSTLRSTTPATASTSSRVPAAEQDGGDFFCSPVAKPTSGFGTSRRLRMEDASGRCCQKPVSQHMHFVVEGIYFDVRCVRIGSMRTQGLEVRFMTHSIQFTVVSDTTEEELSFFVYVADISSLEYILKRSSQPMIFMKVTPGCGVRLRSCLKMTEGSEEYFDPGSDDPTKNMIVIIVETVTDENGLREMLTLYSQSQKSGIRHMKELVFQEANDLLIKSTPPVLAIPSHFSLPPGLPVMEGRSDGAGEEQQERNSGLHMAGDTGGASSGAFIPYNHDEEDEEQDRSPSPPYVGFSGPIEKLLTYPPPPTKGGITITTEDLFCLNEGEFLNDVILDFYLKYLFLEKLSEEDRQRTHIFSSFFFKRLMQKQAHPIQGERRLSLQERRHARVKTWTRQVDIFSKDFLLIPINENAHWFLAIVCFPSLAVQEYISYIPAPVPEEEEPEHPGDPNPATSQPSEDQDEEKAGEENHEHLPDIPPTVSSKLRDCPLGQVIPAETAKDGQSKFSVGLKQACILVMDSLMGPPRNGIIKVLKEYLQVEWDQKKGTPLDIMKVMQGDCTMVPQQTNYSDCGVFVLQYAQSFFENPIANFSLPMDLEHWFPMSMVERKREEIKDLILHLQSESSG